MTSEKRWLLDWFEKRGSVPGNTIEEKFQVNYFKVGLIDSFGVIELIADIENNFKIHFNGNHFQDRRFATIVGLSIIITEIKNPIKEMNSQ